MLIAYNKTGVKVAEGETEVSLSGLTPATKYVKGDFTLSRKVGEFESEKVDVPAFETLPVKVTSVELTPKSGKIDIGGKLKMTVKVLPENATNKNVTFKSSATDIMTIDDKGEVSAVADVLTGESNITVTTVDGNKTAVSKIYIKTSDEA